MIDIHNHILPGVDDGSFDLEESLRMAQMASDSGVTDIVATPHCNLPYEGDQLWGAEVRTRLSGFQEEIDRAMIPIRLHPGMEIFGMLNTPERLKNGSLITLAESRYPLIEFPFTDYEEDAICVLDEVISLGFRPIVAHPERYHYVQREPQILNILTDMGCLLQVNRGSLFGRFGHAEQVAAHEIVRHGFASFVASDAHRSSIRTPWMLDVYEMLCDEYDPDLADLLMKENPGRVLADEKIEMEEPDWF